MKSVAATCLCVSAVMLACVLEGGAQQRPADSNDPRIGLKECELCNNAEWRPGVTCAVAPKSIDDAGLDPQAEALVQAITDQIMSKLNGG